MSPYSGGEILLMQFPFTDSSGAKRRPALVLADTGDEDILVARVTSQSLRPPLDVEVVSWHEAGLRLPSIVRLTKLATLDKRLIERGLGRLALGDWQSVRFALARFWEELA